MYVSWFYSHVFEDLSVKRTTKTLNINEPQPDFQKDYDYGRCDVVSLALVLLAHGAGRS